MRYRYLAIAMALSVAACGQQVGAPALGDDEARATDPPAAPVAVEGSALPSAPDQSLLLQGAGEPPYLVDAAGNALYVLEGNRDGGKCDAACQEVWPPVIASDARPGVAAGVRGEAVASIAGADGRQHVTYNGQPLYRYAGDQGAGRTAGHEVSDKWGQWRLMGVHGETLTRPPQAAPADRPPPGVAPMQPGTQAAAPVSDGRTAGSAGD
ncbi:hypothetical protein [Pseudoxanthomonas mexicana]|uniref:COG4315 family predicted lipoprotein n=1 Tax=Pseudoxanthomonas mexicana TaxID=128785 RepID=UPI00398B27D9